MEDALLFESLDTQFGLLREPSKVDTWEVSRSPLSAVELTPEIGRSLSIYKSVCSSKLLRHAARTVTFLWVMGQRGEIVVSVEELAEMPDGTEVKGFPRRRNYPRHPAEEKKLGHPCLIGGCGARVAGELFLDEVHGTLSWYVNVSSGRYCRLSPPSVEQVGNVVSKFRELIEVHVELDDLSKE